ncbi:nucleotidyltransferase family protein [Dyadobacter sp. CY312]|uniref:nucleotidyltransferase family protein n=1 Tax=Dyadobacter sp. CY312 TaxID=2907303 RepID=UPI001F384E33|nr:nucleotidyltransferase family protein [Dyadobacter sp. CY312]MCE7039774.1 nucleotidyltransferase family protein [Dyadobacter sp. CY312]
MSMINEQTIVEKIRALKPLLSQEYFVKEIGYFGSHASGSARENSDIDILVEFSQPVGWEFFRVQDLLEEALKIKVDLVTPNAIRPQLRKSILQKLKLV